MNASTQTTTIHSLSMCMLLVVGLLALLGGTGCDLTGYGLDPYGWSSYADYPGFTPYYDPTAIIQSVSDYRSDVTDSAADAWDEYIRM